MSLLSITILLSLFYIAVQLPTPICSQEPPLFQPLLPLTRKTRDLNDPDLYVADYYPQAPVDLSRYRYNYYDDRNYQPEADYERNDDPSFQSYSGDYPSNNHVFDKAFLDFLEENSEHNDEPNEGIKKRVMTSFRERMEREKSKEQHEKLAEMFLKKLQEEAEDRELERDEDNRNYLEMIEELWDKYKNNERDRDAPIFIEEIEKRQIPIDYTSLGWASAGYKKRSSGSDSNGLYFLKYPFQKDIYNSDGNLRSRHNLGRDSQKLDHFRSYPEYSYSKHKRFPVAKRSSNFYANNHHKRGIIKKASLKKDAATGTDPKIVKDLSTIFGNKNLKKYNITDTPKKVLNKNGKLFSNKKKITASTISVTVSPDVKPTMLTGAYHHVATKKEELHHKQKERTFAIPKNEPLKIKKKSIDWSNYFGIDRRKKKSESYNNDNEIDNEWLIKRYNNAVQMAVKRSLEYPLNFFRNNEMKKDNYLPSNNNNNEEDDEQPTTIKEETTTIKTGEESKLVEMDDKLKNIEDLIIDEALKYTGSHEGETDPKEIQEVKDKVISRLAAAYNLEKMRRALSEFKSSLAAQKYATKPMESEKHDEAETAMKKKSEEPEKCKEKCEENEFSNRATNEIEKNKFLDTSNSISGPGRCDAIDNRCRQMVNNGFRPAFYSICKWHQLCYLCGTETGSPEELTDCDLMFLSRSDTYCQADVVCQWSAQAAVNFLREVHDSAPMRLGARCDRNVCDVIEGVFNIQRR